MTKNTITRLASPSQHTKHTQTKQITYYQHLPSNKMEEVEVEGAVVDSVVEVQHRRQKLDLNSFGPIHHEWYNFVHCSTIHYGT